MTSSSKRKGDKAELEVQALLRDHLGVPARRALGAGRKDDIGDITGLPGGWVIQVVNWKEVAHAVRSKPLEAERQRVRAGEPFAATFVRLKASIYEDTPIYRIVMTFPQWATLYRETL